jgi:tripartite-type tricarboxylate transporter receptor subunit TctC
MLLKKITVGICASVLTAGMASAADLSGKTVEWTIPFSETGGSAKWANFFAPLLSEALPGNPTVVVKYMPGAGSTKGANWFQRQTNGDGTVMFGSSGSTQFPYLLNDPRVRYEYNDWNTVMASGTGGVAYLNAEDGKLFDGSANKLGGSKKFIYGNQGATSLDLVPALAWDMLGMDVKHVMGVKGRGGGRKMFESGEANIDYQTSAAYLKNSMPLVEAGKAVPMMSWGALDENGNIVRDPTFPDLPTFKEVCEKTWTCSTSGVKWEVWKAFFIAGFPMQKAAFLPAGTPEDVVTTFQDAFKKVASRPDFEKISAKRLGKYPVYTGTGAAKSLREALSISPEARSWVQDYLKKRFGVELK